MIPFTLKKRKIPLQDVFDRIEYADGLEIDAMINAVQRRYSRIFPDWEVIFLSVHSGCEKECRQQMELLIETLRRQYLQ